MVQSTFRIETKHTNIDEFYYTPDQYNFLPDNLDNILSDLFDDSFSQGFFLLLFLIYYHFCFKTMVNQVKMEPQSEWKVHLILFRIFSVISILYFIFATLLQLNDQDWIIGVSLYSGSIVITLIANLSRTEVKIFVISTGFLILISLFCWVLFFINTSNCFPLQFNLCSQLQHAFGFSISTLWLLIITIYKYIVNHKKKPDTQLTEG